MINLTRKNNSAELRPEFYNPYVDKKGWGEEVIFANNSEYCGKLLKFKKDSCFSTHFHLNKRESFYILEGQIDFSFYNLENADVITKSFGAGQCIEIPRGCPHRIKAVEDSIIIEVSTEHTIEDNFRVGKGDSQL